MIPFIILAIENDNDRAFMSSLYGDMYPMMTALAMEIVKDSNVVEDIVHDAVAALIPKVDMLRNFDNARLKSYVYRCARNKALNYVQKQQRERGHTIDELDEDDIETSETEASMEELFEMRDEYQTLGHALKSLPERARDILFMKYVLKFSDEAIGADLGIKKESVREYLTRARRMLRDSLLRKGAKNERG